MSGRTETREERQARKLEQDRLSYDQTSRQFTFDQYRHIKEGLSTVIHIARSDMKTFFAEELLKIRKEHEIEMKKLRVRMVRLEMKNGVDLVNPQPYVEKSSSGDLD